MRVHQSIISILVYVCILTCGLLAYSLSPSLLLVNILLWAYLGIAEFIYLVASLRHYVHWFFHKKTDVIREVRAVLLIYLFFLLAIVLSNMVLANDQLVVLLALVVPIAAGLTALSIEAAAYFSHQKSVR